MKGLRFLMVVMDYLKKFKPRSIPSQTDVRPDLQDPMEERPGLEVAFAVGQHIPLSGIWFRIEKVEKAMLYLVPERITWKKQKALDAKRKSRQAIKNGN